MKSNKIIASLAVCAAIAGFAAASPAMAEEGPRPQFGPRMMQGMPPGFKGNASSTMGMMGGQQRPVVTGVVTSISGSTITLTSKTPGRSENEKNRGATSTPVTVTYNIDASGASVIKNGATSTLANISTGDILAVVGTISGTNVTAKVIIDGVPRGPMMGRESDREKEKGPRASSSPGFTGNGQPVVIGTVLSVGSSTLNITNKSNVQYTVDVSNAVIRKGPATSTISAITVGDTVVVQGAVNGSSITASTVLDQKTIQPMKAEGNDRNNGKGNGGSRGFFGSIGGFFAHMFGF